MGVALVCPCLRFKATTRAVHCCSKKAKNDDSLDVSLWLQLESVFCKQNWPKKTIAWYNLCSTVTQTRKDIKAGLVALDHSGTGRVRLADFYGASALCKTKEEPAEVEPRQHQRIDRASTS
eukprot:3248712-Amphidinium_carterae.1